MNTEKHQGNPYGHFDPDKHEYVITSPLTPRAWSNYLGGFSDLEAWVSNLAVCQGEGQGALVPFLHAHPHAPGPL